MKTVRPSECRISDALERMRQADETGVWRMNVAHTMMSALTFMEVVDPAALTDAEHEFVIGFVTLVSETGDDLAKGGES